MRDLFYSVVYLSISGLFAFVAYPFVSNKELLGIMCSLAFYILISILVLGSYEDPGRLRSKQRIAEAKAAKEDTDESAS